MLSAVSELKMDGNIGASSNYNSEWNQEKAFGDSKYWCSSKGKWPAVIWMKFKKPHRLAKIGFRSRYRLHNKVSFEVIGSEDCNDWTVLLHNDDLKHSSKEHASKTFLIPYLPPFSCLGMRFRKIVNDHTYVCIREIEMWEYP